MQLKGQNSLIHLTISKCEKLFTTQTAYSFCDDSGIQSLGLWRAPPMQTLRIRSNFTLCWQQITRSGLHNNLIRLGHLSKCYTRIQSGKHGVITLPFTNTVIALRHRKHNQILSLSQGMDIPQHNNKVHWFAQNSKTRKAVMLNGMMNDSNRVQLQPIYIKLDPGNNNLLFPIFRKRP